MNNVKDILTHGRENIVRSLMKLMVSAQGFDHIGTEEREKMATQLRHLATLVETDPERVAGVVLLAGEKVLDDTGDISGINSGAVIIGLAPFLAAAYLQFEDRGQKALAECTPVLVGEAMSQMFDATEEVAPRSSTKPS